MNLILQEIDDAQVARGDTLRHPKHVREGKLQNSDRVLANPPFSLKNWGYEEWRENVSRLVAAFQAFEDSERFARVVTVVEIRGHDHHLNICRDVSRSAELEPVDMPRALRRLRELQAQRDEAETTMFSYLGYEV